MSDAVSTDQLREVFREAFRRDVHLLLAWAYADARSDLTKSDHDEVDMTGILAERMDKIIDEPRTPERFTNYEVHNERPVSPAGVLGKKRLWLDIQIVQCGIRPKRRFTIEAKRLRNDKKSSLSITLDHYLGGEGLLRYVDGRYAPESDEAAMLGFIQAHDAEFWFEEFNKAFDKKLSKDKRYALIDTFKKFRVIDAFPDEGMSRHRRASGSPIRVFHICMDCRPAQPKP